MLFIGIEKKRQPVNCLIIKSLAKKKKNEEQNFSK